MKTVHGGDIYSHDFEVVDFSANINPLGISNSVKKAYLTSVNDCENYPDPFCRKLREALANYETISKKKIVCGNGASEIIYKIIASKKPKKALLLAPTFAEYEKALLEYNCEINYFNLNKKNFICNKDILEYIKKIDIIFICNPNNPTGTLISLKLMKKILKLAAKKNVTVVVDECFNGFIENSEKYSVKKYLKKYKNLIIIKAFTKTHAIPGIRLGYGLFSSKKLAKKVFKTGALWSVSVVAQNCGIKASSENKYLKDTVIYISKERKYIINKLRKIGFKVFESKANYIFFYSDDFNLHKKTQKKGFLIRNCDNYNNLSKGFYRIAVKKHEENKRLLKIIKEVVNL